MLKPSLWAKDGFTLSVKFLEEIMLLLGICEKPFLLK